MKSKLAVLTIAMTLLASTSFASLYEGQKRLADKDLPAAPLTQGMCKDELEGIKTIFGQFRLRASQDHSPTQTQTIADREALAKIVKDYDSRCGLFFKVEAPAAVGGEVKQEGVKPEVIKLQ